MVLVIIQETLLAAHLEARQTATLLLRQGLTQAEVLVMVLAAIRVIVTLAMVPTPATT